MIECDAESRLDTSDDDGSIHKLPFTAKDEAPCVASKCYTEKSSMIRPNNTLRPTHYCSKTNHGRSNTFYTFFNEKKRQKMEG